MRNVFFFLLLATLLAGCAAQPATSIPSLPAPRPGTESEAQDILIDFLTLLHTQNYAEATPLYGGEYESLQVFNPQIDPNDRVALWTWVCENRLFQCLAVRSAELVHQEGDTYVFQVEFNNLDGSLFVRGPCCGANETEMPPVSQFEFTVTRNENGKFVVMNTPPYVP